MVQTTIILGELPPHRLRADLDQIVKLHCGQRLVKHHPAAIKPAHPFGDVPNQREDFVSLVGGNLSPVVQIDFTFVDLLPFEDSSILERRDHRQYLAIIFGYVALEDRHILCLTSFQAAVPFRQRNRRPGPAPGPAVLWTAPELVLAPHKNPHCLQIRRRHPP